MLSRDTILQAIQHLEHVLPGQAPLQDFVHHNTLHGFQHLPFEEALAQFQTLTGISGYLPETHYRDYYRQGRITERNLAIALAKAPALKADELVCAVNFQVITRKDVYRLALLADFSALTPAQLQWQLEEQQALSKIQADVPTSAKTHLLANQPEPQAVNALWSTLLNKLDLKQASLHPETLPELMQEQLEHQITNTNQHAVDELFGQVGTNLTMRGLVLALTGSDILEHVRPQLIRLCASAMDEGVAPWTMPERENGFYAAWRKFAAFDANLLLQALPAGHALLSNLPEEAIDTITLHLTHLELPPSRWAGYLERLALELPGWSGLVNWRQQHPHYAANSLAPLTLTDYLAIRLTLDRLCLSKLCQETWKIDATFSTLQKYYKQHAAELKVRQSLYQGQLPEYLTEQAEHCIALTKSEWHQTPAWEALADLIAAWQSRFMNCEAHNLSISDSAWRLFRLLQHLGLGAEAVEAIPLTHLLQLLRILDEFNTTERAKIWLTAYEIHYRDAFFQGLHCNHKRGRWAVRDERPEAQMVLCMDEREESFRRHIEELNPHIETLGAAGFFGIPIHYKGLGKNHAIALCPVNVTPINSVNEITKAGQEKVFYSYQNKNRLFKGFSYLLHQSLRRNLVSSELAINLLAPFILVGTLCKTLLPSVYKMAECWLLSFNKRPVTELQFSSSHAENATPEHPTLGFNDQEQCQRVSAFLQTIGLTKGFAQIVALAGHGSTSQNNPHEAAHDCGACGGRQGGPNARVFAAMANRPAVRELLAQQGIIIPADSWFVGMQHDTCSDLITWFDLDVIPKHSINAFKNLRATIINAQTLSAHERCRRFSSVKKPISPANAYQHTKLRAHDPSQVRPEFGHASNAAAVIGRRSLTQGLFLDRRVFLISYDPTEDLNGKILESILLVAGPVGGGINLEYYFSTINNDRFGCSTKIPHNITGLFGVMEGASSDLRTGLPLQMVEIHEAMRLQILVEAKTAVLERIYAEQESLRELIAGGWVHLSAKDPDSSDIFVFERGIGFVPWQAAAEKLPIFANSVDCYTGHTTPIAPALIQQPCLPTRPNVPC